MIFYSYSIDDNIFGEIKMYLASVRSTGVGDKKNSSRHFEVVSKHKNVLEVEVKKKVKKHFVNKFTGCKITNFIRANEVNKQCDIDIIRIAALVVTKQGYPVRSIEIEIQEVEEF